MEETSTMGLKILKTKNNREVALVKPLNNNKEVKTMNSKAWRVKTKKN